MSYKMNKDKNNSKYFIYSIIINRNKKCFIFCLNFKQIFIKEDFLFLSGNSDFYNSNIKNIIVIHFYSFTLYHIIIIIKIL